MLKEISSVLLLQKATASLGGREPSSVIYSHNEEGCAMYILLEGAVELWEPVRDVSNLAN